MTREFWPRRPTKPEARSKRAPRQPRPRRPRLPLPAGNARQLLSGAIPAGNHELASWIDAAVKTGRILPKPQPQDLEQLKQRLDEVMQPLPFHHHGDFADDHHAR